MDARKRRDMKWELTPQFFVSAMNFAAIVFAAAVLRKRA
jgi:hypothetical protein